MTNNKWNLIISGANTGAENMALDEAAFQMLCEGKLDKPLLRFYTWSEPCITIGYFQKYSDFANSSIPVIRRLTGGLAVNHSNDISYSLVVSEKHLPCVRDQQKTYMIIHSALRAGLAEAGIQTEYCSADGESKTNLCTASIFAHDLAIGGKKILGSCQRRRGNVLLQQGSIHVLIPKGQTFEQFARAVAGGFAHPFLASLAQHRGLKRPSVMAPRRCDSDKVPLGDRLKLLTRKRVHKAELEHNALAIQKYSSHDWNAKS